MWQNCKAIRPLPGFHVDQPANTSKYTADLFATIKNDGRILDDVRCVLGVTDVVEATFKLDKLFEDPTFKKAIVKIQR